MATFQIHQDAEKENPHMVLKEKSIAGGGKAHALQPSVLQTSTMGGAAGAFKDKAAQRTFAVLKNGNARNIAIGAGGSKVAFREVRNVKVNDENAGFAATTTSGAAAAKKSTVVPVVEQFKTFSVYEDQNAAVVPLPQQKTVQHHQHVSAILTESIATVLLDKENIYIEQEQQQLRVGIKNDSLHKDFGIHDEDYALDATPMSVSDVLSPMSVDRSQITNSASQSLDDSNCNKIAQDAQLEVEQQLKPLPRNDRQRFFEVVEYQRAILEYFRESEKKHRPKPNYMRRQTDINYSMRTILVDWLVEVSEEYNLDTETLYLSVSYIDRFLSHMSVVRSKLQLVGTAAMYIASKYEEIYPPDVGEFVFITDDTYNKAQVLRMEQIILKILAFDLCTPTAFVFINTYAVLTDLSDKLKFLTQYICELSLLEADPFLRFHPSIISAASLALARYLLEYPIWSVELEDITAYRLTDLKEVLLCLCKSHNAATTLAQQAIQEKYKADKYKKVSAIEPIDLNEEMFDEICCKYNDVAGSNSSEEHKQQEHATAATSNENVRRMISLMFN